MPYLEMWDMRFSLLVLKDSLSTTSPPSPLAATAVTFDPTSIPTYTVLIGRLPSRSFCYTNRVYRGRPFLIIPNMSVVRTMIRITADFFMMTPSRIALVLPGNYTDMKKLDLANLVDDIRRDWPALDVER